jgi:hypothetical protein
MKNIAQFIRNVLALIAGKSKVHATAVSINGSYSYGRVDFSNELFNGEIRR